MHLLGIGQLLKPGSLIGLWCPHLLFHVDFHMVLVYLLQPLPKTQLHRYDIIKRNVGWSHVETVNYLELVVCTVSNRCWVSFFFPSKFKTTHSASVSLLQHPRVGTVTIMFEKTLNIEILKMIALVNSFKLLKSLLLDLSLHCHATRLDYNLIEDYLIYLRISYNWHTVSVQ